MSKGYNAKQREMSSEQTGKTKGCFGQGRNELNTMEWRQGK